MCHALKYYFIEMQRCSERFALKAARQQSFGKNCYEDKCQQKPLSKFDYWAVPHPTSCGIESAQLKEATLRSEIRAKLPSSTIRHTISINALDGFSIMRGRKLSSFRTAVAPFSVDSVAQRVLLNTIVDVVHG